MKEIIFAVAIGLILFEVIDRIYEKQRNRKISKNN